jgi:cytochrome c-type biogenesis protein
MEMIKLFLEGLLSFFSPCVLPLVPLYIGYLTQDAKTTAEDGTVTYRRGRTLYLTAGFILGICAVFVIAGLGSTALHAFFIDQRLLFQLAGGVLLILFGLVSLNIITIPFLHGTHAHHFEVKGGMNFLKAYLMGFFFSFAWSPCVGPLLAQAMVKAASAQNAVTGWLYIASYALGFITIFLLLGIFTTEILNFLKKYRGAVKYTGILAGIIVIAMGFWTLGQGVQTYNASVQAAAAPIAAVSTASATASASSPDGSSVPAATATTESAAEEQPQTSEDSKAAEPSNSTASADSTSNPSAQATAEAASSQTQSASEATPSSQATTDTSTAADIHTYDFTLQDGAGKPVSLSSYKGKTIVLNFFGTWCGYCKMEMPDLQKVNDTKADVQVLLVAAPGVNGEGDISYVEDYMRNKGYSMKIVYDTSLTVTHMYQISGYPTTFIYQPDGMILGYAPGYLDSTTLNTYIDQARG